MLKKLLLCLLVTSFLFFTVGYSQAEDRAQYLTYGELITLGKSALKNRQYEKAKIYFKLAYQSNPKSKEPRYYFNLAQRVQDGRVKLVENKTSAQKDILEKEKVVPVLSSGIKTSPPVQSSSIKKIQKITSEVSTQALHQEEFRSIDREGSPPKVNLEKKPEVIEAVSPPVFVNPPSKKIQKSIKKESIVLKEPPLKGLLDEKINLDMALWAEQPNTLLTLEVDRPIIVEGKDINQFLILSPEVLDVEQLDKDHLKITPRLRGETFVHLWDDQGRWTFSVETVYPAKFRTVIQETNHETAKPFVFSHSADWNSNYLGDSVGKLERQNLHFFQWMGIEGESPYGELDASVRFTKFKESTEVTGYTVGLTDGKFGNFKDFSIRGFDASARFSPLTLPGKYFRGVLFRAKAFNENVDYTMLWGRDRLTYGYLSTGDREERESFIEGAKVTLFPNAPHSLSLNYAQGYGSARPDFLKKRAYSIETLHRFKENWLASEVAHDEDHFSELIKSQFGSDNNQLRLNFRDIHEDFTTASTFPSDRGEIGGNIIWDLTRDEFNLYSNFDIYQDRLFPNAKDPQALNYDLSSSMDVPLSERSSLRNSIFYAYTPGELSPRNNVRTYNTYNHNFEISDDKMLSTFVGGTYQRSRFTLSPSSEFDRYSFIAGLRFPIKRNLNYYFNYEYSWVDEILTGERSNPQVYSTGLNYSTRLTKKLTSNWGLSYRNEEETEGLHSFLAGEDSIMGSAGLNYRPSDNVELFVDGRLRNIWAENPDRDEYAEGDIRVGLRSSWDTPFVWSPVGEIRGVVFKDLNQNNIQDEGEPGLEGIKIRIGNVETCTNARGVYSKKVRGTKVDVELDVAYLPEGYITNTSIYEKIEIIHHGTQTFNFALTTRSGIYGVIFFDKNRNNLVDPNETLIAKVKITLDNKETVQSGYDGSYFFENIPHGPHKIKIDINSIPIEYLPQIRLQQDVEIQEGTTYILHIPLSERVSK